MDRWMMLGEIVPSSKIPLVPRLSTRNPRQTFLTDINIFLLGTIVGQQYVEREKGGRRHCPGNYRAFLDEEGLRPGNHRPSYPDTPDFSTFIAANTGPNWLAFEITYLRGIESRPFPGIYWNLIPRFERVPATVVNHSGGGRSAVAV